MLLPQHMDKNETLHSGFWENKKLQNPSTWCVSGDKSIHSRRFINEGKAVVCCFRQAIRDSYLTGDWSNICIHKVRDPTMNLEAKRNALLVALGSLGEKKSGIQTKARVDIQNLRDQAQFRKAGTLFTNHSSLFGDKLAENGDITNNCLWLFPLEWNQLFYLLSWNRSFRYNVPLSSHFFHCE